MKGFGARARRLAGIAALALLAGGCASNPVLEEGRRLAAQGRHPEAVQRLGEALREMPANETLRAEWLRQRELAISAYVTEFQGALQARQPARAEQALAGIEQLDPDWPRLSMLRSQRDLALRHQALLDEASAAQARGQHDEAERLLRSLLAQDATDVVVRERLNALMRQRAVQPAQAEVVPDARLRKPVTLEFRDAPLRNVFEALTRLAGVNFVFDKDVRGDARITIFLRDVTVDEAVRVLLQAHSLDMRRLNPSTYMVFPDSQQKARQYVPLEARSFYLSNIDAKQAQAMVRSVVKSRDMYVDDRLNMLVVKDTPEALALIAQLLRTIDIAEPEVLIEVEVIEISRNRMRELGIRYPTEIRYGLPPSTGTVVTRDTWAQQVAQTASPSLIATLRGTDGASNLLSNPRIRVRNRDKAKIHIGEKLPVFTTNFTSSAGLAATGAFASSVSYLDVGLKLDVEPQIYLEDEVSIKVSLEVSSVISEVKGPADSLAYRIGTRNSATVLRLRDGETQILAGLIREDERKSAERIPGLGDLPLIGKLFSSEHGETDKTEIILMLTPRIVRGLDRVPEALSRVASGTDAAAGQRVLQLSTRATGALAPAGAGSPAPRAAAPGLPQQAEQAGTGAGASPPESPAASPAAGPASAPAGGQLSLSGPAAVKAGQILRVSFELNGALQPGAGVEVSYDPDGFLPADSMEPGSGRAEVTLRAAGSGRQTGELVLRASVAGARAGQIRVDGVRAVDAQGAPSGPISIGAPLELRIDP